MLKSEIQWLRELPYDTYSRAWVNVTMQNKTMATAERQTTSLSDAIINAFTWHSSTEGREFWQAVYDKYYQQETSLNKDLGEPYSASRQPAPMLCNGAEKVVQRQVPMDETVRMLRINGAYCDSADSIQE